MPSYQHVVNSDRPRHEISPLQSVARSISMSSLEIADLTAKLHAHVIRDIRVMLKALGDDPVLDHVREDKDSRGYTEKYHLNRELTETLVTGYSVPLRLKVIRRLHELEQAESKPAFDIASLNDPKVLLALLTDNVRKVVHLEADNTELTQENHLLEQKVVADAPKVEFFNAVITSTSIHSVREVAQSIGTGQNRLFAFMRQQRWVDRHNTPYQGRVESGYLVAEPHSYNCPETGERKTKFTCKVTGKGFTKLQALWAGRDKAILGGAA
ncbi:phage regulatory protein/antirepressor Ant [Pseudomonas syringae]|uniref:phage antirepressor KilAC domain-containing protein n=1 Tax=Pseudomonas syringae group TaxID=136849 RepID=UPI000CF6C30A|nr:phage regulatory protein/antirepressor Ant [Pseudomonas syringae]AVI85625.1 DNA-binding protein [Pseudomonas syringae pv. tomato]MBI6841764.1 phage regulatory protein/antirepressor Ant [Pseudomonas syringae]QBI62611.1 DNA-binding protein [Pseudomonas syringae]